MIPIVPNKDNKKPIKIKTLAKIRIILDQTLILFEFEDLLFLSFFITLFTFQTTYPTISNI